MTELMTVVAVIGITTAIAVPSFQRMMENRRLKDAAVLLAGTLDLARTDAIRTGNVHVVFYTQDTLGNPLVDAGGQPVPVLILDDGRPGVAGQNCLIDAGEPIRAIQPAAGISSGVLAGTPTAPADLGTGTHTTGSSFTRTGGGDALWVAFRPQGFPVSLNPACSLGAFGSGAGAFYIRSNNRGIAVVLSPSGGTRVHSFVRAWSV